MISTKGQVLCGNNAKQGFVDHVDTSLIQRDLFKILIESYTVFIIYRGIDEDLVCPWRSKTRNDELLD